MTQLQSGPEAAAAALVGSFGTFSLIDVLDLLARTGHTGELQVVGRGVDHRLWVDQGDLLEHTGDGASATLFELACIEEGWFYFTAAATLPEGRQRLPVADVLEELGPQVSEWRDLVAVLPADAVLSMSSTTPGDEVQIRADQWKLLSLVGAPGRTVRDVIDSSPQHPLETLRTLRELVDAQLVSVEGAVVPKGPAPVVRSPVSTPSTPAPVSPPLASVSPIGSATSLVAVPPPPSPPVEVADVTEPPEVVVPDVATPEAVSPPAPPAPPEPPGSWSPTSSLEPESPPEPPARAAEPPPSSAAAFGTSITDPFVPGGGRASTADLETSDEPSLPPLRRFDARAAAPPVPPAPDGWTEPATEDEPTAVVPPAEPAPAPQSSVLPPPISGDPWTTPISGKEFNGDDGM